MPIDARNPLPPLHTIPPRTARVLVLEVLIPGDGHEDVRNGEYAHGLQESPVGNGSIVIAT